MLVKLSEAELAERFARMAIVTDWHSLGKSEAERKLEADRLLMMNGEYVEILRSISRIKAAIEAAKMEVRLAGLESDISNISDIFTNEEKKSGDSQEEDV
jgi:hypothetical protein